MGVKLLTFVLISLQLADFALAGRRNDWKKPCRGECFYDLPPKSNDGDPNASSGTLKIWSTTGAIGDITPAAGWEILGCDANAEAQDIRVVCAGDAAECEHLFDEFGAVDKVVRLPENCGASAFAHISSDTIAEDQTIPEQIAKRMVKRDGVQVHRLRIDTNFAAADPAKVGVVKFALLGATLSGADEDIVTFPSDITKRGLATGFVTESINAVRSIDESGTDLNRRLFHVELDKSYQLPPFDYNKRWTLYDGTMTCNAVTAHLSVEVAAQAHAEVTVGFAAEGELVPPRVDDFAIYARLNGYVKGSLDVTADATGYVILGQRQLLALNGAVVGFPGILTVGPSLRVHARASANMNIHATFNAGISYTVTNATLVFPPTSGLVTQNKKAFSVGSTAIKLIAKPSVTASANVQGHIIPGVYFGIDAIGGAATADISLKLDAGAKATGSFSASVTARRDLIRGAGPMGALDLEEPPVDQLEEREYDEADLEKRAVTIWNGCVDIDGGFDVIGGANANFFNLFTPSTSVTLWSKDYAIFDRCWGSAARRSLPESREVHQFEKRLACPATLSDTRTALLSRTVPASSIVAS